MVSEGCEGTKRKQNEKTLIIANMLLASTTVLGMNTAGLNDSINDNRSHSPTKEISRSEESKEIEK